MRIKNGLRHGSSFDEKSGHNVQKAYAEHENMHRIDYYLAEGCTRPGFETWLTILNASIGGEKGDPPKEECYVNLQIDYTTNEGVVASKTYPLPMQARTTINVNAEIGGGYDVSFKMRSVSNMYRTNIRVYIERPMYFSYGGLGGHEPWQGGHVNTASNAFDYEDQVLVTKQYFAEGTTRPGFEEWICVLNPNDEPTKLTFNYMIQGVGLETHVETLAAKHRGTWYVPNHVGMNRDVSLELVSDQPVLAERPMYFAYGSVSRPGHTWYGGHITTGIAEQKIPNGYINTFAFAPLAYVSGMGWGGPIPGSACRTRMTL